MLSYLHFWVNGSRMVSLLLVAVLEKSVLLKGSATSPGAATRATLASVKSEKCMFGRSVQKSALEVMVFKRRVGRRWFCGEIV